MSGFLESNESFTMSIKPLPRDVVAQLKSSTTITSLNAVICDLLKNSLDAEATKITIDVDYARGGCLVEDNGLGILPSEFAEGGGLGKMHHTSKANTDTPLYGHQGTFLASLSVMALVSITSHHHQHRSHNTLTMHRSEVINRQIPSPLQHHMSSPHGTKISVRDLFGSMPVRMKQRAIVAGKQGGNLKEWEELKRQIVLFLLSWNGNIAMTLRDKASCQNMVLRAPIQHSHSSQTMDQLFICNLLSQASLIDSDEKALWVPINASTPKLALSGAISLEPSATKSAQFLSLGIYPLFPSDGQSMFQDEINRLFANSNFGNEEDDEELDEKEGTRRANDSRFKSDGYTKKELKGGRKGVDRWPKFYIRIQPAISERLTVGDILEQRGNLLSLAIELLQAMIHAFLTKHHFRPKGIRRQPSPRKAQLLVAQTIQDSYKTQPDGETEMNSQPLRSCLKPAKPTLPLDLFGANVKFPSFKSSAFQLDNSLESWSRIKSGRSSHCPESPVLQDNIIDNPFNIRRPSTAPPLDRAVSSASKDHRLSMSTVTEPSGSLLSKEGKLVRKPFEDVDVTKPQVLPSEPIPELANLSYDLNEMELWVNPITKARYLVNGRTGYTIAEKRASSTSDLGHQRHTQERLTRRPSQTPNPKSDKVTSPWLTNILQTWDNPVFQPAELAIPQISFDGVGDQTKDLLHGRNHHCNQIDIDRAFKECSSGLNGRISKVGLSNAKVISQVDGKFVLVSISCVGSASDIESDMLVIVDQHAADERIRIEALMEELCSPIEDMDSGVSISRLEKPINFEVPLGEITLLQNYRSHFADWGILYDLAIPTTKGSHIKSKPSSSITILAIPLLIRERCKQDPKLVIRLIRTELWKVHESKHLPPSSNTRISPPKHWLERIQTCPQGIIDMLNSRACRSAIMFNDILTRAQCQLLVRKLGDCKFPFQCAHGRPSLVPLVDLAHLSQFSFGDEKRRGEGGDYGERFRAWKENLNC